MSCVTGGEFSDGDMPGDLTPEREAEIMVTLGELLDDELDYPVLWRLPDGTRVKI